MSDDLDTDYPLLAPKSYAAASVFRPENLLREARRQKRLPDVPVPRVCLLDPDGDVVDYLSRTGSGRPQPGWACYHTQMWTTTTGGVTLGVVGNAVGAPFAVLVAEQLAASGADLVISITSAGQLAALGDPPYFVLIDRALRDEGTSVHYQPPATWSRLDAHLDTALTDLLLSVPGLVHLMQPAATPCGADRPGPPTPPTGRRRTRSRRPGTPEPSAWRWRRPLSTRTPPPGAGTSCAWRT